MRIETVKTFVKKAFLLLLLLSKLNRRQGEQSRKEPEGRTSQLGLPRTPEWGSMLGIAEILDTLNFVNSNTVLDQYPFQLSGGMLQRVMIALAIWMKPEIIIADEPTTALDAIVQKEILKQFSVIRKMIDVSLLLITHDLGVVAEIVDDVIVMKEEKVVEKGNVYKIFNNPQDPYTKSLLSATFRKEACLVCRWRYLNLKNIIKRVFL